MRVDGERETREREMGKKMIGRWREEQEGKRDMKTELYRVDERRAERDRLD